MHRQIAILLHSFPNLITCELNCVCNNDLHHCVLVIQLQSLGRGVFKSRLPRIQPVFIIIYLLKSFSNRISFWLHMCVTQVTSKFMTLEWHIKLCYDLWKHSVVGLNCVFYAWVVDRRPHFQYQPKISMRWNAVRLDFGGNIFCIHKEWGNAFCFWILTKLIFK